MKKRLLLLVLTILGSAQMQAGSWFESLRNYSPYQWDSVKRYAPENVASRLATIRYLYGNDIAEDQKQLINDYSQYLWDKYRRQESRNINLANAKAAACHLVSHPPKRSYDQPETFDVETFTPEEEARLLQNAADYIDRKFCDKESKGQNKERKLYSLYRTLRPTIEETEAELLRPKPYYQYMYKSYPQYQHPDQYILNN